MQVIEQLDLIKDPYKNAVITIGNFDGVHLGHQALFHEVVQKAEQIGGTAIAMTFEPHPIRVVSRNGAPPLITPYRQKKELIARTELDVLICVPFTLEFAAVTPERFVKDILVDRVGMKAIVVGDDYSFGKNREGNVDWLKAHADEFGYEVVVLDRSVIAPGGTAFVSSTRIRELVAAGEMEKARSGLGRHYQIRGTVVKGRNRGGRLLGIPTANLELVDELCPRTGIYAVTVEVGDRTYKGVANIGYSPTFDDHVFTVEVHILDFDQAIYGEDIRVNVITRIRDEIRFDGIDALVAQIHLDIEKARDIITL